MFRALFCSSWAGIVCTAIGIFCAYYVSWANWIGRILCRNCLLWQVIEGKIKGRIEVTGRRGRRRTKLLDDLKERRGYSHLKEEAVDHTMWRARSGRGFGLVMRQTTKWMNEWMNECQLAAASWHNMHKIYQLLYIQYLLMMRKKVLRTCRGY
jgi:hypothetical protein